MTEDDLPASTEIANIEDARTNRFLDQIREDPFVALVISEDGVKIYVRADLSAEHIAAVQEALAELIDREEADGQG